jgi:hypothetical protein
VLVPSRVEVVVELPLPAAVELLVAARVDVIVELLLPASVPPLEGCGVPSEKVGH